jgi:hypothetical protein
MSWKTRIVTTGVMALFAAACDTSDPSAPPVSAAGPTLARVGASCAVDVGSTQNPLPALHELEGWLNDAIEDAGSSLNCGQVRSLDAKMETLTKSLDQTPPNFHAACGVSGALVNELESLVERGELAMPEFEPPFPGGPTNVLAAAEALNARWCAAARGELVGPRSSGSGRFPGRA